MKTKKITFKKDINYFPSKGKRYQIILANTNKSIEDYNKSIKNRLNGSYSKLPAFAVTKEGEIYQYYNPKYYYSNFMHNIGIDKISIPIVLENYGAVFSYADVNIYLDQFQKEIHKPIKVYKKQWRDNLYWDEYGVRQIYSLIDLLKHLIDVHNIEPNIVNSNTYNVDILKFKGIVSRSNHYKQYLDVNPSFDFEFVRREINEFQLT